MANRDKNIDWLRVREFIPIQQFTSLMGPHVRERGAAGDTATEVALASVGVYGDVGAEIVADGGGAAHLRLVPEFLGVSTPVLTVIDTGTDIPFTGALFAPATNSHGANQPTPGTDVDTLWHIPYGLDRTWPVGFRVAWTTGSSTAADTANWIVSHRALSEGSTLLSANTALATSSDNATATAFQFLLSPRVELAANTLAIANRALALNVELDAIAAGLTEQVFLLGLEVDYMPRLTYGAGVGFDRAVLTDPLDHDGSP